MSWKDAGRERDLTGRFCSERSVEATHAPNHVMCSCLRPVSDGGGGVFHNADNNVHRSKTATDHPGF